MQSPLSSSHLQHYNALSDDEDGQSQDLDAYTDQSVTEEPRKESYDQIDEHQDQYAEEQGTGESTPPGNMEQAVLPRDQQRRTAYYDYASEKSLSHAEAKLFYQRHQLDSYQPRADTPSPLLRARTVSSHADGDVGTGNLSRTGSINSRQGQSSGSYNIRNATSIGLATFEESIDEVKIETAEPNGFGPRGKHDAHVTANQAAKSSLKHFDPRDAKTPILSSEDIPEADVGIGVGVGTGGYAIDDANVTSELNAIYTNIQKVLDMRHKYIRLSLQGPGDNPKDDLSWTIYPPPPEPVWDDEKDRPLGGPLSSNTSLSSSKILASDQHRPSSSSCGETVLPSPSTTSRKYRKPGQDIGEDFDMLDLEPLPSEAEMTFKLDTNSVFQVYETSKSAELEEPLLSIPTMRDFYADLESVLNISSDGPSKSFAFRRLQYLEGKFNLYILLNEYQETADSKRVPHRDFYNVRKVDTHVHHSACMNQKHLLRFIKSKMKKSPDEIVMFRDEKHLTLREVFESINLTAYDLSIDTLDMHVRAELSYHLSSLQG